LRRLAASPVPARRLKTSR